jgi:hypothetical protein
MLHAPAPSVTRWQEKLALAERFVSGLDELIGGGLADRDRGPPAALAGGLPAAARPDEALPAWNQRNAAFLAAINGRQRVHLSSTLLPVEDGAAFTLRVCVLSFRTHERHVERCLEDLAASAINC